MEIINLILLILLGFYVFNNERVMNKNADSVQSYSYITNCRLRRIEENVLLILVSIDTKKLDLTIEQEEILENIRKESGVKDKKIGNIKILEDDWKRYFGGHDAFKTADKTRRALGSMFN